MTGMTTLRLTPMDVALFRDARPFSANDSSGARLQSRLPPQLGLLGAMRLLLLRKLGLSFQDFGKGMGTGAVGPRAGEPGILQLGPVAMGLQKNGQPESIYGMPADIVRIGRRAGGMRGQMDQWAYQIPWPGQHTTSLPEGLELLRPALFDGDRLRFARDEEALQVSGEVESKTLPNGSLLHYLLGEQIFVTGDPLEDALPTEKRLGIERNAETFTAVEGRLYTAEFLRASTNAFFALPVWKGGEELVQTRTVVTVGGESRPFEVVRDEAIRMIPADAREKVREALLNGSESHHVCFRVLLLSPSPSGGKGRGWMPRWPEIPGVELSAYAAAVPRARWLSGWMTGEGGGRPRNARPYIPAGAVYFVKAESPKNQRTHEQIVDAVLDKFWYRSSLTSGEENLFDGCAGNGATLVGAIPNAN